MNRYCYDCRTDQHWPGECATKTQLITVEPTKPASKPATDLIIVRLDSANKLLAEAKTIQQTKNVVDVAHAAEIYAKRQKLGEQAIGYAHSIKVYALRKLGEMLKADPPKQSGAIRRGTELVLRGEGPTLADLGIDKKISSLAQKIADLPDEKVAALAARVETINGAHVGHNSGDNEWYTPKEIIAAAKRVMGGIDLDPASSNEAQAIINADEFYTNDTRDRVFKEKWRGRIWLNPPYAQPLIGQFVAKLISESAITQAIALVNNATETEWGQSLLSWCDAVCFPSGRVRFWHPRKVSVPLQGQMILYRGKRVHRFIAEFKSFGVCKGKA